MTMTMSKPNSLMMIIKCITIMPVQIALKLFIILYIIIVSSTEFV